MCVRWCVRARYACVQYSHGAWAWPRAFCAVLCGCVLCGCVMPTGAGCAARVYAEACAPHFTRVYMRYGVCACGTAFGLGSPNSVSCTCMDVCTAVGMCSPSVVPLVVSCVCVRVRRSVFTDRVVYFSCRGAHACICTVLTVCCPSRTPIVCTPYMFVCTEIRRCSYCS